MEERGTYGERLSERFGVTAPPTHVSLTLNKSQIAVTRIRTTIAEEVLTEPIPYQDAFLVQLNLTDCPDHELWMDGRSLGRKTFLQGETVIHDLKCNPVALIHTPMDSMMLYLSRKLLNEICDDADAPRLETLRWAAGDSLFDPVVQGLGSQLTTALHRPNEATALFVDHVTMAITVHIAAKYGDMRTHSIRANRRLSAWQERRAKELLMEHIDGKISLVVLAQECGMSVSHFTRLFRRTIGEPPHRWLMRQRVEKAKSLLHEESLGLADVALACGFFDQSHLTRCFSLTVGVAPGAWRREHGFFGPNPN